jgi:serine/threonine-protein phosphatase 2A regulatory subunit A
VREAMTQKLKEVVAIYGLQWASKKIIPRLVNMGTEKAYLARLTTLFAIAVSWRRVPSFFTLPTVLLRSSLDHRHPSHPAQLSSQAICDTLDAKAATNDILPVLLTLSKDPVPNVRFNAAKVMGMIAKKVDGRCVVSFPEPRANVFLLPVCRS